MEDNKTLPAVQQQQLKKLYFKPSATEALHSAILLKARNNPQKPSVNKIPNKMPNINSLLSISTKQADFTNSNDDFELESPFKIKENILCSVKSIKSGLDILRTSTSDDEDNHTDNLERKKNVDSDIIILESIRSVKRGKEEALSNSSSSDEEDLANQKSQKQAMIINLKPIQQKPKFNNVLSLNTQPPFITPVVSSNNLCFNSPSCYINANLEPELINSPSSLSTTSSCCSSSSSPYSISSASSVKSQKSCSDQDSFSNSILSIGSPTSCCSSLNTNDGIADLNDDSSSTSSGPVYVRQPGFEHHAHEVIKQDVNSKLNTLKNFVINTPDKSKNKITNTKKLNYSSSTSALPETADKIKAKKKLCIMNADCLAQMEDSSVQLKPISNRQKREPLPMRLRALPPSFWQQPNQSNVSPATMYLPPLFKNDIDNNLVESNPDETTNVPVPNQQREREVRMSPANTDLLFKLFDNIEQKDKKQVQLILQSRGMQKTKTLSKALIKGEDPCILDAVSEGLFPQLKIESKIEVHANTTPALASNLPLIEQNYSQALSEIVAAL